jgi:ArsR family transcriptional regulator
MNTETFVSVCKALSDPHRVEIVHLLVSGEECACKILERFSITQPTLSHHMRILSSCNLVAIRKEGKWSHYSLNQELFESFGKEIAILTNAKVREEGEAICRV